jgi:hypothetical protein
MGYVHVSNQSHLCNPLKVPVRFITNMATPDPTT